jgi:ABC-type nitrate/sulfonate/bicarbonate transport system permease component
MTSPAAPRVPGGAGLAVPVVVTAVVVIGWELLARVGVLSPVLFPAPSVILEALTASLASGEMVRSAAATLLRTSLGLLFGAVPGLLLGFAMGASTTLRRALDPLFAAVHPIPKIAILPLLMLFFGIGEGARVAVGAVAAFFPMLINTMAGVRQINPLFFEVARSYGATRSRIFRRVIVPGSLPMVFSGARLAVNVTLLVTIAAEIVMADQGLGSLVWLAWETLRVELLYATLVVIAVLGVALTGGLRLLRRALAPWQVEPDTA